MEMLYFLILPSKVIRFLAEILGIRKMDFKCQKEIIVADLPSFFLSFLQFLCMIIMSCET